MEKIAVTILFTENVGQFSRLWLVVVVVVKVGRRGCIGLVGLRHLRQLVHALRRLMTAVGRTAAAIVIGDIDAAVVVGTLQTK